MQAELYEELNVCNLGCTFCLQEELKEKLQELDKELNLKEDTLIIRVCKEGYKIYYSEKDARKNCELIQLNLALRFRIELDIFELQQKMLCVDEAALIYPFSAMTDKYCLVRHMDLNDNFLILDVYLGVTEWEDKSYNNLV